MTGGSVFFSVVVRKDFIEMMLHSILKWVRKWDPDFKKIEAEHFKQRNSKMRGPAVEAFLAF